MDVFEQKKKDILKNYPHYTWIDSKDRLYKDEELFDKLKIENQIKFWIKNCEIRQAFKEIEGEIKKQNTYSKKIVSWSNIARIANCDRNTLKKQERFKWVNKKREDLIELIETKLSSNKGLHVITPEKDELKLLKENLLEIKKEAGKWFIKYERESQELTKVKFLLEKQIEVNKQLSVQNSKLLKELNK